MLALAFLIGIYIAMRLGRRAGVGSAQILDFSSWVIIVALIGAKVLLVLTLWSYYRESSRGDLKLRNPQEGWGFLRRLPGGALLHHLVRAGAETFLLEVCGCAGALRGAGHRVTRLGCFSAGCDYGKPTTLPWGVVFSSAVAHENTGVPLGVRLHPAQLYESFTTLVIFVVLLWRFPRKKQMEIFSLVTWACTPWDDFFWNSCVATKTAGLFFITCFRRPNSSRCWCWQGLPRYSFGGAFIMAKN